MMHRFLSGIARQALWLWIALGVGVVIALVAAAIHGPRWLAYPAGIVFAALLGEIVKIVREYAPTTVRAISGGTPLRAVIESDESYYSDEWSLLLPHEVTDEDHPPPEIDRSDGWRWFAKRGAYDADASHLRLVLENVERELVIVTGIRAHVLRRESVLSGALVTSAPAGEKKITALQLNLDSSNPEAKTLRGHSFFRRRYVSLDHRETHVFRIEAKVRKDAVDWEIEITYIWRGVKRTLRLDNTGEPFRTAPSKMATQRYSWVWWEPIPSLRLESEPLDDE
jgi:hypothetical protein